MAAFQYPWVSYLLEKGASPTRFEEEDSASIASGEEAAALSPKEVHNPVAYAGLPLLRETDSPEHRGKLSDRMEVPEPVERGGRYHIFVFYQGHSMLQALAKQCPYGSIANMPLQRFSPEHGAKSSSPTEAHSHLSTGFVSSRQLGKLRVP